MSKVGLVQMNSGNETLTNLAVLESKLRQLKANDVQLVLTPENTVIFGKKEDYERHAEELNNGPLQKKMAQLAAKFEIWLVIGSFPIRSDKGIASSCLVYDDKGNLVSHYQKLHLFDASVNDRFSDYRESTIFHPGDRLEIVDSPIGKLGLSICYDLRFPELFSSLRLMGADIILVPAAFTQVTGAAHWQILLQARAIENQCWIIAAAQCGSHQGGRDTFGHSMIIDPWGQIVGKLSDKVSTLWADIDLEYSKTVKQRMPVQQHARFQAFIK